MSRCGLVIGALLVTLTVLAADAPTNINAGGSTLTATFKQEGVPVDAPLRKFSGRIVYDAAHVAEARASLEVTTGSLDIGDKAYNDEVHKKAWFDSATYPKAVFASTAIKATGAGHFEAAGTLTMKGRTISLTIPVTVSASGPNQVFDGTFVVSRKAFGIGDPGWDDVLDDKVSVRFHLISPGR